MKQQKLTAYTPNYPKKAMKGAALAAATLLALGTATGCRTLRPETVGIVPMEEPGVQETQTPELPMTTGMIEVAPTPEIPEEPSIQGVIIPDESAVPETEKAPATAGETNVDEPEELEWMGDVAVIDEQP